MENRAQVGNLKKSQYVPAMTGHEAPTEASGTHSSISEVLSKALSNKDQEALKNVLAQLNTWFKSGREYVSKNRTETAVFGLAAIVAGYALFKTKPGRKVFASSAAVFLPEISKWISQLFETKH